MRHSSLLTLLLTVLPTILLACGGEDGSPREKQRPSARGGGPRTAVPDRVPDVTARDLSGEKRSLRALIDRPTVVNFWATWCGPCRREMPELVELDRQLADSVRVIGIALDSGSPSEIRAFARKHGVDYLLLRSDNAWAREHFGVFGMPTTFVVDRDGRIQGRLVGPQTVESLREVLRPLL